MQAAAPEKNALVSVTHETPSSVRASDVVFLRALVETRGSFRDFEKLFAAAVAANQDLRDHIMNRALARDLLGTMAFVERRLTYEFVLSSSAFRLQADGLHRELWGVPAFANRTGPQGGARAAGSAAQQ